MKTKLSSFWGLIGCIFLSFGVFSQAKFNILVFSKTVEFRHESVPAGKKSLEIMAKEKGFNVTFTEDAQTFNEKNIMWYFFLILLVIF
jgi:hypothetical protein